MKRLNIWVYKLILLSITTSLSAQNTFTLSDTLRGSITPERAWWDVLRYDLAFTPNYKNKTIQGSNTITYKVISAKHTSLMQIDLKDPLVIDSVIQYNRKLKFEKVGSVWYATTIDSKASKEQNVKIYYSGQVHEAKNPPWDGGFTFTQDSLGRPWMTVTCQGLGASIWYPCKDHQSDEPDQGASLSMTVSDTLVAIGNGRLLSYSKHSNGTATYKWGVISPISNYCIIPYIGKYVNFKEKYTGEKGKLDLDYWVLDYNLTKAKEYMPDQVHKMFASLEHWFGPYPFYKDGYKLIETSNTGMEHQSAVSYGNRYKFGYRGKSHSTWGMKFDFIILHESAHEWFGNNITTNDLADMWVHEGFANYSESLFTEYHFGKEAGNEYSKDSRKGIRNDVPIIPAYNVNAQGSGDMYPKAGNLIHSIRNSVANDKLFRKTLRGLNQTFYHQTVSTLQIESYISKKTKFDYQKVFDQYLRTIQIPKFEYYFEGDILNFRYKDCVDGFNLPISLSNEGSSIKIFPNQEWKSIVMKKNQKELFAVSTIEHMYYITAIEIK